MQDIINILLQNLQNVGIGCGLFIIAYVSNVLFSLWYNIKILCQKFDYKRLINSVLKILAFGGGTCLLVTGITLIPHFANYVGFTIPEEYVEVFQDLAILSVFIIAACRYLMEAYTKFKLILNNSTDN